MHHTPRYIAALATLTVAACTSAGPTGVKSGNLTVTIVAPQGMVPNVTISAPGQRTTTLTATTTLHGLPVGIYSVDAAPVTTSGPVVGTVGTAVVTGSPVNVAEGTNAAASVTYSRRAGTGGLWVTYFFFTPQTVVQYSAAQLAGSSTASPAVAVTTNGAESVGVAFDASGNLWTSVSNIPELLEYSASQLASSNTSAPTVILTSDRAGSLNSPAGLAFDSNGNLWVANASSNTLVEYASAQLASSGSPIPIITIGSSSESLQSPYGLAFDASGSLWITTTGPSPVVALAPDQLLTSGAPTPAVSLSFPGISGFSAQELAFDAKGNLWVSLTGVNAIAEIPAAALTTTGAPFPSVVLTSGNGSINDPAGLAFDDSGDLWVANSGGTTVVEFTPGQLLASGSPKPVRTITGDLPGPFGLAFDPHAANLPLKP